LNGWGALFRLGWIQTILLWKPLWLGIEAMSRYAAGVAWEVVVGQFKIEEHHKKVYLGVVVFCPYETLSVVQDKFLFSFVTKAIFMVYANVPM
jgi:hypothetical protein